jgi:putative oxidoreductase
MRRLLELSFIPRSADLGLLLIRLGFGFWLFTHHGWEKVSTYSQLAKHYPDPLGLGAQFSLTFALISDAVCSVLLAVGLLTRPAAIYVAINVAVAFLFVQHGRGENTWSYFWWATLLFCAGPGRYSLDYVLFASARDGSANAASGDVLERL